MNYGLYLSTSGLLASKYRQDVFTNNLANITTVGFKEHMPQTQFRDAATIEDNLHGANTNDLLERLGGGVKLAETSISFSQGTIQPTGSPLDLAIEGDGFFVLAESSEGDTSSLAFTRDGRFTLNDDGQLTSVTTGARVLDTSDRPIQLRSGSPVEIGTDGTIHQDGQTVARIQIADVPDRQRLTKAGNGRFLLTNDTASNREDGTGAIRQGAVEAAAVSDVKALMKIQAASGEARANAGMIRYHDQLMGQVISRLGRTA